MKSSQVGFVFTYGYLLFCFLFFVCLFFVVVVVVVFVCFFFVCFFFFCFVFCCCCFFFFFCFFFPAIREKFHHQTLTLSVDGISGDLDRTSQIRMFPSFYNIALSKCHSRMFNVPWQSTEKKNYHEPINDLIPYTASIKKHHLMIIYSNKKKYIYVFKGAYIVVHDHVRTGNLFCIESKLVWKPLRSSEFFFLE